MKNTKYLINICRSVPEEWQVTELENNLIRVSYSHKGSGLQPKSFTLRKILIFDDDFITGIAMYLGDGKLSRDLNHLDFCSIDKDMILFMINFFERYFHLDRNTFSNSLYYRKETENMLNDWSDYLNIYPLKINVYHSDRNNHESFSFQIGGKILRILSGKIVLQVLLLDFLQNENLRRAFLRGIFAAEGTIAINKKTNYIVYMEFFLHYDENHLANKIQEALRYEGIKYILQKYPKRNCQGIRLTHWSNYYKCWKIGLFDLNERKRQKFFEKMKKTRFSCRIIPQLKAKILDTNLSQRQLAFKLGVTPSIITHLKNRDMFVNIEYLIKISTVIGISLSKIKQNITEFRVNDVTTIDDKEFIDFAFEVKSNC